MDVLNKCMDLNIASGQSLIPETELPDLHQQAADLLDILQQNLPDKTGEKSKWNFEKAKSILHKVLEIVLWGNMNNLNTKCHSSMYWYIPVHTGTFQYVLRSDYV